MKIEAKRVSKRHPNRTEKPPKSSPKKHQKKERFWESVGAPLKCPGITPKQGTCPQRTPPTTHKTTQDPNKITTPMNGLKHARVPPARSGFGEVLGWFGESFWEPKGLQNGFKI